MNVKNFTGLAIAVLLAACGGSNDHTQGPQGTWSTECINGNIRTYVFDRNSTLILEDYSDEDCTDKRSDLTLKFNTLYDPELKTTSSGVDALKMSLTLASDVTITLHNNDLIEVYEIMCSQQNWAVGQTTSIMACGGLAAVVALFDKTLPMLLYIDGNNLYTSIINEPKGDDGFPSDVNYEKPYMKQ